MVRAASGLTAAAVAATRSGTAGLGEPELPVLAAFSRATELSGVTSSIAGLGLPAACSGSSGKPVAIAGAAVGGLAENGRGTENASPAPSSSYATAPPTSAASASAAPAAPSVSRVPLYSNEQRLALLAIQSGRSVVMVGDAGCGKTTLARMLQAELARQNIPSARADWLTQKDSFKQLAEGLGIATTTAKANGDPRDLSTPELKEALADLCRRQRAVLCIDNASTWSAQALRFLETLVVEGEAVAVLLSVGNPNKGLFLKCAEIPLQPPSEGQIREIVERYAVSKGVRLSPAEVANLQRYAGSNPMLARAAVDDRELALLDATKSKARYLDIAPFVNSLLIGFGVLRFIGLGTGDRALYILGGVALLLGLALSRITTQLHKKQRRLGQ